MEASHLEAIRALSPLQTSIAELTAGKVMAESLSLSYQNQSETDVKELAALRLGRLFPQYLIPILPYYLHSLFPYFFISLLPYFQPKT